MFRLCEPYLPERRRTSQRKADSVWSRIADRCRVIGYSAGYRFDTLDPGERNSDSLFVCLMFSGGGTRAAALSYGVMEALRDKVIQVDGREKRLLDEVDCISSVSGGSFTAAYYGLYRERLFEDFRVRFLERDVQGALAGASFSIPSTGSGWLLPISAASIWPQSGMTAISSIKPALKGCNITGGRS